MDDLETYARRHLEWSLRVFGPGHQTESLTRHIEKELVEVRAKPDDLIEWVDVILLALDGYLRHGGTPATILADLRRKQEINLARTWTEPAGADQPVEHVRSDEHPKT